MEANLLAGQSIDKSKIRILKSKVNIAPVLGFYHTTLDK
jgi:hypothetical protein